MSISSQFSSFLRVSIACVMIVLPSLVLGQSEESALRMVKALRLGENLEGMTYQFAKVTTTYRGIEARLGPQQADTLLRAEIAVVAPKHQEQWNKNLAQAWQPLMTPEEIDSIITQKQQSPYASKFMSLQDKAGTTMKANSEPWLKTVLAEVLTGVFEKSMPNE
jgi:hypothetical protein